MKDRNYERAVTKSGWSASIQASTRSYCIPRADTGPYTHVEIGYPSAGDPLIHEYAEQPDMPTETVYGTVPAEIIMTLIDKHGGLVSGECPPLTLSHEGAANLAELLDEIL